MDGRNLRRWRAIVSKLVESSFAHERAHVDPSVQAIKQLATTAMYHELRFVIDTSGTLYIGDSGKFTHESLQPDIVKWVLFGYIYFDDEKYTCRAYRGASYGRQSHTRSISDHPSLRLLAPHRLNEHDAAQDRRIPTR